MPFIDRLRPPLSSVRFPHYQLGTEAATLLIERIEAPDSPAKVLFLAPELVARGSTVPPAGGPRSGDTLPLHRARGGA
jgi:LacI family transcriptional regulator